VNLGQLIRQPAGQPGDPWHLVRPGSQHNLIGDQLAAAGADEVAVLAVAAQPGSRDTLNDRRAEGLHVILDVADDIVANHEAIRIFSGIREVR
jgi:hypothetical protein